MSNLDELVVFYLELCQYEKKLSQDTLKALTCDNSLAFAPVGRVEKISSAAMLNT